MQALFESLTSWLLSYKINIVLSTLIIISYLFLRRVAIPKIEHYVEYGRFKTEALVKASATLNWLSGTMSLALIFFIWGFDFKELLALSTGLIALTGAALFASWSILSNITAFFLLLIHRSYRRGNFLRIIDADNYVEGYISEINLFNTKLVSESREIIIYPNNLLIARPTVINPKNRFSVVGKTSEFLINPSASVASREVKQ